MKTAMNSLKMKFGALAVIVALAAALAAVGAGFGTSPGAGPGRGAIAPGAAIR